jgi:hypothetical protein
MFKGIGSLIKNDMECAMRNESAANSPMGWIFILMGKGISIVMKGVTMLR